MSARTSAHKGSKAGAVGTQLPRRPSVRLAIFLAALLALTLTLAPRVEAFVYWSDFGPSTIGRANLDGTGVDQRFITRAGDFPGDVAVDAAHVYWTDFEAGTIARANLNGTRPDPSFITGLGSPDGVAVDAGHLYWANYFTGTIGRANLDGTGVDQSFITGLDSPGNVAVDSGHVYWTNFGPTGGSAIGRANLDGAAGDPTFITEPDSPDGVAVDAGHVYWADFNAIGRANLDGTDVDPNIITGAGESPVGVAVDAAHIYWADSGSDFYQEGRKIGRANLDGTGVNRRFITRADVRSRSFRPSGVAVDALRSFSFGKVKRNEKRGTAKLTVVVPGPGELKLAKTKKVKRARKGADAEGSVKLPVKSRGDARKKLNRKGKAKVKAEVTHSPQGGDPTIVGNTDTKTVKLVKRR